MQLSELMSEENINALNDIYHQNELNLESFLEKIQEKEEELEESNEDLSNDPELQDVIKEQRLKLKYISLDKNETGFASERSLQNHKLSINKLRNSENSGRALAFN
jgi:hypothetical protein